MGNCKMLVKEILAGYAKRRRKELGLTQEQMAERLRISSREYGNLERGKYCFSGVALLFLLFMMEDEDIVMLLGELDRIIYLWEEQGLS